MHNRPMGGQLKPWDGKSPISIAAGVLYLITSLPRATRHPTTLAIAEASGVAEVPFALRPKFVVLNLVQHIQAIWRMAIFWVSC